MSDIDTLSKALLPGSIGFNIDAQDDGLESITHLLAATGAKYLAIIAHGEPGVVHLGKTALNLEQIQAQSQLLSAWDVKEIALYSCEVARGDVGKDLIYQLSELTGATVAAAETKTGSAAFGGSWDLAVTTGAIAAPMWFAAPILESYQAILPTRFSSATNFAVGSLPQFAIVGDFNGDGKLDLATTTIAFSRVSVLLGNGSGGFGAATNFGVERNPYSLTVGDFNSDGKLDLATASPSESNVSVLLGNGSGGFEADTNFDVGTNPYSVKVGDFNSDGKLDLATANSGSNNVSMLLGNGSGGFGAATNFGVGDSPDSITVGDLNGDGKLDLATANSGSNNVSVLLGDGIWGFGATTNLVLSPLKPNSVTVGDFNGDSKLDLVTVNSNRNNVSVLLNISTPTRTDFNGDGKSDILWRNTNGAIAVWTMDGATVTASALTSTPSLDNSWKVAGNSDFNGDGKADILWRNDDGSVALWQMNGAAITASTGCVQSRY